MLDKNIIWRSRAAVARQVHILKVVGSNPSSAPIRKEIFSLVLTLFCDFPIRTLTELATLSKKDNNMNTLLEYILFFPVAFLIYGIIYGFVSYTTNKYVDNYMKNMYDE